MATPATDVQVHLEPGSFADIGEVILIMESAFGTAYGEAWTRSQCAGILPMTGVTLTLARAEADRPVGFSLVRSVADESELLLLGVMPEHQRQGIGSLLLDYFIKNAREQGSSRLHLEVRRGNPAAAMYRNAGFVQVGRRQNYYSGADGQRFDALTLALEF
jgi:ribosomal-protein-alanine N-acetyltransferase